MLIIFTVSGCGVKGVRKDTSSNEPASVKLWVTKDFGNKTIYENEVDIKPNQTVMDLLKQNLDIETSYGGGFVNSINGLKSGYTGVFGKQRRKMDWFYYVNGIMSSKGALDYMPQAGDIIWWDYHPWGNGLFKPAVTGAFPQPFLSGYNGKNSGTLIMYVKGFEKEAAKIKKAFEKNGIKNLEIQEINDEQITNRDRITVVLGLCKDLINLSSIKKMMDNRDRIGVFLEFDKNKISLLDPEGEAVRTFDKKAGAIFATATGLGDKNPLWIITGIDNQGLDSAIDIIADNNKAIKQSAGVVITQTEVFKTPYYKEQVVEN
ncbi:MAG: hypothetical protein PWQ82_1638 [Thermosediminibacterales bacterium]|nr:hypothetical protein [Thermosediminibacterales bacterium]MDK2836099.1 hypothetical protein [Thermosediminibacterales bacterium]